MTICRADVDRDSARLLARQSEFRTAADVAAAAWRRFPEVEAIALNGSVAMRGPGSA